MSAEEPGEVEQLRSRVDDLMKLLRRMKGEYLEDGKLSGRIQREAENALMGLRPSDDERDHGPFFAVVNEDGTLRCNEVGDPYVFKAIGPHDNHTKYRRRVVPVMIVERDQLVRMTKLDVSAEVGQPFEASAVFEGDAVKIFAAHMAEWFRANAGENFVTVEMTDPTDGTRLELTMRRAGAKTPAQLLTEMRAEIEELRGVYEQPLEELCAKLPNVRPDFIAEVQQLSNAALQRRVLIQADWLGSYSRCLDDFNLRVGVEAARNPREIRRIVDQMRALLQKIYNADKAAAHELINIGLPVDPRFAHQLEDMLGLPSTRGKPKPPPGRLVKEHTDPGALSQAHNGGFITDSNGKERHVVIEKGSIYVDDMAVASDEASAEPASKPS